MHFGSTTRVLPSSHGEVTYTDAAAGSGLEAGPRCFPPPLLAPHTESRVSHCHGDLHPGTVCGGEGCRENPSPPASPRPCLVAAAAQALRASVTDTQAKERGRRHHVPTARTPGRTPPPSEPSAAAKESATDPKEAAHTRQHAQRVPQPRRAARLRVARATSTPPGLHAPSLSACPPGVEGRPPGPGSRGWGWAGGGAHARQLPCASPRGLRCVCERGWPVLGGSLISRAHK